MKSKEPEKFLKSKDSEKFCPQIFFKIIIKVLIECSEYSHDHCWSGLLAGKLKIDAGNVQKKTWNFYPSIINLKLLKAACCCDSLCWYGLDNIKSEQIFLNVKQKQQVGKLSHSCICHIFAFCVVIFLFF